MAAHHNVQRFVTDKGVPIFVDTTGNVADVDPAQASGDDVLVTQACRRDEGGDEELSHRGRSANAGARMGHRQQFT